MGAFLGLLAGLGLLLVWHGFTARPTTPRPRPRAQRTREHLIQAGLPGVTPAQLVALQVLRPCSSRCARALRDAIDQRVGNLRGVCRRGAAADGRPGSGTNGRRTCANCGQRWSTTSHPGCAPGCRYPRRCRPSGSAGPEQLREPFKQFGSDYRTTGRFNESLDRLKDALADPVGDRVCESLRVAREVGGTDLGRLLSTLSGFLRDDARTRAELLARQSWSVNAATDGGGCAVAGADAAGHPAGDAAGIRHPDGGDHPGCRGCICR